MKIKFLILATSLALSGTAFAGLATAPGPASAPSGAIIPTPSVAKAIARAETLNGAGARVSVITVGPNAIAALEALRANPPNGATVTTAGNNIVNILNVTMNLNGSQVLVDVTYNLDTKQVTITRRS